MVTGGGWGDSGRGEARLGVGEGGGGAGEGAHARNRGLVAGGGRSKKGGDSGASGRAPLVFGRREEERKEVEMTGGSHNQINIWALLWRTVREGVTPSRRSHAVGGGVGEDERSLLPHVLIDQCEWFLALGFWTWLLLLTA